MVNKIYSVCNWENKVYEEYNWLCVEVRMMVKLFVKIKLINFIDLIYKCVFLCDNKY